MRILVFSLKLCQPCHPYLSYMKNACFQQKQILTKTKIKTVATLKLHCSIRGVIFPSTYKVKQQKIKKHKKFTSLSENNAGHMIME